MVRRLLAALAVLVVVTVGTAATVVATVDPWDRRPPVSRCCAEARPAIGTPPPVTPLDAQVTPAPSLQVVDVAVTGTDRARPVLSWRGWAVVACLLAVLAWVLARAVRRR